MSIKSKTTQHKPTREDRQNRDLQDLKSENRSLRKQMKRLRKQLTHSVPIEPIELEPEAIPDVGINLECSKCGSPRRKTVKLPTGTTMIVCQECKHREKG